MGYIYSYFVTLKAANWLPPTSNTVDSIILWKTKEYYTTKDIDTDEFGLPNSLPENFTLSNDAQAILDGLDAAFDDYADANINLSQFQSICNTLKNTAYTLTNANERYAVGAV